MPGHEDQDDVTDCISQHTPQLLGGNAYGKQPISTRQNNKRLIDIFVLNYNVFLQQFCLVLCIQNIEIFIYYLLPCLNLSTRPILLCSILLRD